MTLLNFFYFLNFFVRPMVKKWCEKCAKNAQNAPPNSPDPHILFQILTVFLNSNPAISNLILAMQAIPPPTPPALRSTSAPPPRARTAGSAWTTTPPSPAPACRASRATSARTILLSAWPPRAWTRGPVSRLEEASHASVKMDTLENSARLILMSVSQTLAREEHAQTW